MHKCQAIAAEFLSEWFRHLRFSFGFPRKRVWHGAEIAATALRFVERFRIHHPKEN
jgi:hypothetical protein